MNKANKGLLHDYFLGSNLANTMSCFDFIIMFKLEGMKRRRGLIDHLRTFSC